MHHEIENKMQELIWSNKEISRQNEHIKSIPGVGSQSKFI